MEAEFSQAREQLKQHLIKGGDSFHTYPMHPVPELLLLRSQDNCSESEALEIHAYRCFYCSIRILRAILNEMPPGTLLEKLKYPQVYPLNSSIPLITYMLWLLQWWLIYGRWIIWPLFDVVTMVCLIFVGSPTIQLLWHDAANGVD
ncbi:hypothetical protein GOP47_0021175 [Adiantum capillus-veneris]|uniref:Uncharacterized protein n=1 Tax=Adiantum capillus-veneris TaxID=13818 RepID=A0A9D4UAV7_ADICA|nr:hypothetical protein GOP47_0021175 [Adiantum capillus-veneris]